MTYPLSFNLWTGRESNPHGEAIDFGICFYHAFFFEH